ncbi:hypothetical protein [Streptomyces sp. NPDC000888]
MTDTTPVAIILVRILAPLLVPAQAGVPDPRSHRLRPSGLLLTFRPSDLLTF